MIDLNLNPSKKDLRIFSLGALAFFAFVGWIVWRKSGSATAGVGVATAGAAIAVLGFAIPRAVRPIFVALMVINYPIGWVVTHVVMAFIFYLVVTPLAAIMKLRGRDPMERRFDRTAKTYWKTRANEIDSSRYFRQF
jgi:Saxitoxin biosynthesis operon protein SxtJ